MQRAVYRDEIKIPIVIIMPVNELFMNITCATPLKAASKN
jgi:hypothetical protein